MHFHHLAIKSVIREPADTASICFAIPPKSLAAFAFEPGQYLTLRAQIQGQELRRNYSISSSRSRLTQHNELEIGIRAVPNGTFSNWAVATLRVGDVVAVMPPNGRFTMHKPRAIHRVGFAVGSGITPILSIAATSLEEQADAKFTLVYGNKNMASTMFNEALQDLKDRFLERFTMIHVLSRQVQEVDLLQGRIDKNKVRALLDTLLPVASLDEVFICGPHAMMQETQSALLGAGVRPDRIRKELFQTTSIRDTDVADASRQDRPHSEKNIALATQLQPQQQVPLRVLQVLHDGKYHDIPLNTNEFVLDAALNANLDLPYSCKSGVCCTCRAKILEGQVRMEKNFTLEPAEIAQGFILSCQAKALTAKLVISYDER